MQTKSADSSKVSWIPEVFCVRSQCVPVADKSIIFSTGKALKRLLSCLFIASIHCRARIYAHDRNTARLVVLPNRKGLRERNARSLEHRRLEA